MPGETPKMEGEEMDVPQEPRGNEPDAKPLSETGYKINPDGSIGRPGEEWDSK